MAKSSQPEIRTRWSSQDAADQFTVDNPATGAPLAVVQGAGDKEVDQAVQAAYDAHFSWKARTARERGSWLRKIAQAIREHADEIATLECSDNGKPLTQARNGDVNAAIGLFEYFASLCDSMPGQVNDGGSLLDITVLEPYGVIAAIVPFNWPPIHTASKLAPALAVGNAVVIKPPEQAPLSAMRMVEIIQSVLPDDVVHILPGTGSIGSRLAGHPLVGKISFTGSPTTGVSVIKTAADNLTPTLMELGGKDPFIIFEDADLDLALPWAIEGGLFNQGEACTSASRVLVHVDIYDEVARRYGNAVKRLRVGNGIDPGTHIGPMVSAAQRKRVLDYIDIGIQEGATIAAQAPLPDDPELAGGYYVAPTLFTGVRPDMRIAQEEIFGPVISMIPFHDEDEAVRIANGTEFGLVAAVFTPDSERALRVSRALHTGFVFVNNYNRNFTGTPFGGVGASGYGRETSAQTLGEYGYSKSIRLVSGRGEMPRWAPSLEVTGHDK
ncbi:aldehyde dehydrogenase family protein [Streptomyces europaeiscabiei]|uniref:aldehyde dehydrogenase family protein n=1 Tax=Streptomyces europaeiscabiei TaxID=146819 RepID=UPI0006283A8E|nr:aldehyde dehydrogenase family protein [Streptomyces europaeiscabiei]MDX3779139.1 aldehyde dehydrogenase family protein [Streptomyces europaeiscabiei]MDX3836222.1 aldehyde dehydrogenase family protein [Streptomyces europaeiscabiei]MDX3862123.1 aldehyde dehydrogenase family protein [Streptomyces europaeiscabiei]MDX3873423.1 aldehyde dehydrogenase family protein [Streptomyces europaeiscabiei]